VLIIKNTADSGVSVDVLERLSFDDGDTLARIAWQRMGDDTFRIGRNHCVIIYDNYYNGVIDIDEVFDAARCVDEDGRASINTNFWATGDFEVIYDGSITGNCQHNSTNCSVDLIPGGMRPPAVAAAPPVSTPEEELGFYWDGHVLVIKNEGDVTVTVAELAQVAFLDGGSSIHVNWDIMAQDGFIGIDSGYCIGIWNNYETDTNFDALVASSHCTHMQGTVSYNDSFWLDTPFDVRVRDMVAGTCRGNGCVVSLP
jgi:hypothetical protein